MSHLRNAHISAQPPRGGHAAGRPICPTWCSAAGHHGPDFSDGARLHTLPVGRWLSVVQLDHPGGREPAAVVMDDVELPPGQALQLSLDLVVAAGLIADSATAARTGQGQK